MKSSSLTLNVSIDNQPSLRLVRSIHVLLSKGIKSLLLVHLANILPIFVWVLCWKITKTNKYLNEVFSHDIQSVHDTCISLLQMTS